MFYPPREYGVTSVAEYAEAMRQRSALPSGEKLLEQVQVVVQDAITAAGLSISRALTQASETLSLEGESRGVATTTGELTSYSALRELDEAVQRSLNNAAQQATERVREGLFLTLHVPESGRWRGGTVVIPYNPEMPVGEFVTRTLLETIGKDLRGMVDFGEQLASYGHSWAWHDAESQQIFYADAQHDPRPIADLGIRPGMTLVRIDFPFRFHMRLGDTRESQ